MVKQQLVAGDTDLPQHGHWARPAPAPGEGGRPLARPAAGLGHAHQEADELLVVEQRDALLHDAVRVTLHLHLLVLVLLGDVLARGPGRAHHTAHQRRHHLQQRAVVLGLNREVASYPHQRRKVVKYYVFKKHWAGASQFGKELQNVFTTSTDLKGVEGVSGDGEEAVEHGGARQQRRHRARARAWRREGPQQLLQRERGAGQAGQDEQPHLSSEKIFHD